MFPGLGQVAHEQRSERPDRERRQRVGDEQDQVGLEGELREHA